MYRKNPYLITRDLDPENQETPIHFIEDWITPEKYFFIRNHFEYPYLTDKMFEISIEGEVENPSIFTYEEIKKMPSKEFICTLECSGNKRDFYEPRVYGEQWHDGAISQGIFKGVSLKTLLDKASIKPNAYEVVFEGHDFGTRKDIKGIYHYARSLPLEKAMHLDTIIAYQLNHKDLPFKQGYPLRLIVPNWYAMASVKWLKSIKVIDHHFEGPFQDIDYNYYPNKYSDTSKTPVTTINVSSIIQKPLNYAILSKGRHLIKGIAWTGMGYIENVEVSVDYGNTWENAKLLRNNYMSEAYSWVFWEYEWNPVEKGEYSIFSKATDSFKRTQPPEAYWNRKGYGYNAIYKINVKVE